VCNVHKVASSDSLGSFHVTSITMIKVSGDTVLRYQTVNGYKTSAKCYRAPSFTDVPKGATCWIATKLGYRFKNSGVNSSGIRVYFEDHIGSKYSPVGTKFYWDEQLRTWRKANCGNYVSFIGTEKLTVARVELVRTFSQLAVLLTGQVQKTLSEEVKATASCSVNGASASASIYGHDKLSLRITVTFRAASSYESAIRLAEAPAIKKQSDSLNAELKAEVNAQAIDNLKGNVKVYCHTSVTKTTTPPVVKVVTATATATANASATVSCPDGTTASASASATASATAKASTYKLAYKKAYKEALNKATARASAKASASALAKCPAVVTTVTATATATANASATVSCPDGTTASASASATASATAKASTYKLAYKKAYKEALNKATARASAKASASALAKCPAVVTTVTATATATANASATVSCPDGTTASASASATATATATAATYELALQEAQQAAQAQADSDASASANASAVAKCGPPPPPTPLLIYGLGQPQEVTAGGGFYTFHASVQYQSGDTVSVGYQVYGGNDYTVVNAALYGSFSPNGAYYDTSDGLWKDVYTSPAQVPPDNNGDVEVVATITDQTTGQSASTNIYFQIQPSGSFQIAHNIVHAAS
jgi:hypothetical protein